MQDLKITINGVTIPDECPCLWCGSTMKRKGQYGDSSGVTNFTMWCDNCGAIAHHAHDKGVAIKGISVQYR